jgi:hypothetical protein
MKIWVTMAVAAWAFAVGFGMERLWNYSLTPGLAAPAPGDWPDSTLISPRPGQATLIMFIHPRCPCSRASLEELRVTLERRPDKASAWVLFMRPQGVQDDWPKTASWKAAQQIPGVTVAVDSDGAEAARFGATTSGHVVLYDAQRQAVFSGGITAARGHLGENDGERQLIALLDGSDVIRSRYPVYGCKIHDHAPAK